MLRNKDRRERRENLPNNLMMGTLSRWLTPALYLSLVFVAPFTVRANQDAGEGEPLDTSGTLVETTASEKMVSDLPPDTSERVGDVQPDTPRQKTPVAKASNVAPQEIHREKPSDVDPFLAGALGIIPLASGYYVTESPASGVVFTLVDALLALGIYTSRYTERGDPGDVKYYYALMGANNILDALMSARHVAKKRSLQSRVSLLPEGGIQYALHWKF